MPFRFLLFFAVLFAWYGVPSAYAQMEKVRQLEAQLPKATTDTARMRLFRELSAAYRSVDPAKKLEYSRRYGKIARRIDRDSMVAESYIDIGIAHAIPSRTDSAMLYFRKALDLSTAIDYQAGRARSLLCMGYTYDILDNSGMAISCYKEALHIYRKIKNVKGINQSLTNIGSLYFDLKQYAQARTYFSQVYDSYRKLGDQQGIAYALFTLGNADLELGQYERSEKEYKQSLQLRKQLGDITGTAMSSWGLGKLANRRNEYRQAEKYLEDALESIRKVGDPYQEAAILLTFAKVYRGLEQYGRAQDYARQALRLARKVNNKSEISIVLAEASDIEAARGDFRKAYAYLSEHIDYRDSINAETARRDLAQAEYNRIQSEYESLEKDNALISNRNTDYVTTIAVVSVLLVVVAVLLVLYYRRNIEKQVVNRLLEEQKEEIAAINAELESQVHITERQNQELNKLNAVKNKVFSIVSHDLRSPMSTLQMLFSLYREGQLKEMDVHDTLLKLEDTIYTTNEFLDNLLEWAKNQLEGMTVRPERFSLGELAQKNISLIDSKIRIKQLTVTNAIAEDCRVYADPDMVDVVMRNLLSNSVKFCKAHDSITLQCRSENGRVVFSVSDTGPGIGPAEQQRLFSLENTLSTGSAGERGHHIGLILCRDMVELNGGRIWVESTLGEGTTISVSLPASANSSGM